MDADFSVRAGRVEDAAAINDIYKEAKMILLDDDIEAGSAAEEAFWAGWVDKWRWRLAQPSQVFVVAVVHGNVVGVVRGGVNKRENGEVISLLTLREKEAACAGDDVPLYTGPDDEEACLGAVCRTFDAEINGMFVRPQFQRRGIGKALMAAALAKIDGDCTVWTWTGNADGIAFYDAIGATPVGYRKRNSAIVRYLLPKAITTAP